MDADPWVPIAALQHYLYCPRQSALIHVERHWQENRYTAEGRVQHERVDQRVTEQRRGVQTATALPIGSEALRLHGVADVVEFDRTGDALVVRPVEHKRSQRRAKDADEVQLCAQALCLEDMLGIGIEEGALYHGNTRGRRSVAFTDDLRQLTRDTVEAVRAQMWGMTTPPARYEPRLCDRCSLIERCQPKLLGEPGSVKDWLQRQLPE